MSSLWICPSCQHHNPPSARFCGGCAAPRPASDLSLTGECTSAGSAPATPPPPGPAPTPELSISGDRTRADASPRSDASATPSAALHPGLRVGRDARYELLAQLGEGGMGAVWKARDTQLGREVAIKRILGHASPMLRERFQRETQAVTGLRHPNIVTVFDAGEDAFGLYLVMEFVPGQTLAAQLLKGALPAAAAIATMQGLCRGAAHAHKKGVVHRDIKPANVMVDDDGVPRLLDFGLVRLDGVSELSLTNVGMGTLDYAAPEQKRDASKADARSDVYALGLVFYELLTGLRPPVTLKRVPEAWRPLIEKATDGVAADRHANAEELLTDLDATQSQAASDTFASQLLGAEDDLRCPRCKLLNTLEAKFCRSCSASLRAECPACSNSVRVGLKHCDQCAANMALVRSLRGDVAAVKALIVEGRLTVAGEQVQALATAVQGGRLGAAGDLVGVVRDLREDIRQQEKAARRLAATAEKLEVDGDIDGAAGKWQEAVQQDDALGKEALAFRVRHTEALQLRARLEAALADAASQGELAIQRRDLAAAESHVATIRAQVRDLPAGWQAEWVETAARLDRAIVLARCELDASRVEALVAEGQLGDVEAALVPLREHMAVLPAGEATPWQARHDAVAARMQSQLAQAATLAHEAEQRLADHEFEVADAKFAAAARLDRRYADRRDAVAAASAGGIAAREAARARFDAACAALGEALARADLAEAARQAQVLAAFRADVGSAWLADRAPQSDALLEQLSRSQAAIAVRRTRQRRMVAGVALVVLALLGVALQQWHAQQAAEERRIAVAMQRVERLADPLTQAIEASRSSADGQVRAAADVASGQAGTFVARWREQVRSNTEPVSIEADLYAVVAPLRDALLAAIARTEADAPGAEAAAQAWIEQLATITRDAQDVDAVRSKWRQRVTRTARLHEVCDGRKFLWELASRSRQQGLADAISAARTELAEAMRYWRLALAQGSDVSGFEQRVVALGERFDVELSRRPEWRRAWCTALAVADDDLPMAADAWLRDEAKKHGEDGAALARSIEARDGVMARVVATIERLDKLAEVAPVLPEDGRALAELRSQIAQVPTKGSRRARSAAIAGLQEQADRALDAGLTAAVAALVAPVRAGDPQARARLRALEQLLPSDARLQPLRDATEAWLQRVLTTLEARLRLGEPSALTDWQALKDWYGDDARLQPLRAAAAAAAAAAADRLRRAGLAVAPGAANDLATGLPHKVVHSATGVELILIPAGEFLMGSPASEAQRDSDEVQHRRHIREPFYLGVTEVTQAQWRKVMGDNPSRFQGDNLPVEQVSWEDCQQFLEKAGGGLRLPSEAEWEYACRAGTTTPFAFGSTITPDQVNYDGNYAYGGGSKGLYRKRTVAAGSLPANAWGLHEMHGNVWEWCQDGYEAYPGSGTEEPSRAAGARVLRGGGWNGIALNCRAAFRHRLEPGNWYPDLGLRLARTLRE